MQVSVVCVGRLTNGTLANGTFDVVPSNVLVHVNERGRIPMSVVTISYSTIAIPTLTNTTSNRAGWQWLLYTYSASKVYKMRDGLLLVCETALAAAVS